VRLVVIKMSSGVDTLSSLAEKLKQTINEIQDRYESFIDSNQLYKQGRIEEREFFASIGDYLAASSAMNFITVQTIFEMKSIVQKKASTNSEPDRLSSLSGLTSSQDGTGINRFTTENQITGPDQFTLPKPQEPIFKVSETDAGAKSVSRDENGPGSKKDCNACGKAISKLAKFCSRCGNSQ
jgi:hypothetical protein